MSAHWLALLKVPWVITRVGGGIFSSALDGGKAPKDGGDHLVVVLEGIVVTPRWSAASGSIIGVIFHLFVLKLLSQAKAVLHLMLGVLVERARGVEDLLVLLIIVVLGARFIDGSDDVVWPTAAILARLRSFRSIMATVTM